MTSLLAGLAGVARSDVGCVRKINEDAVLAVAPVFAVADGMGGHAAGDVAAALILERLSSLCNRVDLRPDDVLDVIALANDDVVRHGEEFPDAAGLGATLAGVCLGEFAGSPHWFIFNVGDARVYRQIEDGIRQVTIDHSEVQELVDVGEITLEQARHHPNRNIVTRSIGTQPPATVDLWLLPAMAGDRFLICSDGLTGELTDAELGNVVLGSSDSAAVVDDLIENALKAGARDNVSVVMVELVASALDQGSETTAPRARLNGAARA